MAENPQIRELFIEELADVNGGGPVEELLERVTPQPVDPELGGLGGIWNTTMACGEEASSGC